MAIARLPDTTPGFHLTSDGSNGAVRSFITSSSSAFMVFGSYCVLKLSAFHRPGSTRDRFLPANLSFTLPTLPRYRPYPLAARLAHHGYTPGSYGCLKCNFGCQCSQLDSNQHL